MKRGAHKESLERGQQSMPNQKSEVTGEIQEAIVRNLSTCVHRLVAAECAGVSRKTFDAWMRKGRLEPRSRCGDFRRAILEAERRAEIRLAAVVAKAALSDPNHAQWLLSHRFPRRWANLGKVQLSELGALPAVLSGEEQVRGRILGHLKSLRDSVESEDSAEAKATEVIKASVVG
jgi:hypothetical protein